MFDIRQPMNQRIFMGTLFTIITSTVVFLSMEPWFRPFFALFIGVIISFTLSEFYILTSHKGITPLTLLGILGSLTYTGVLFFTLPHHTVAELTLLGLVFIMFSYYLVRGKEPLINLSVTLFGILYITLPLGCLLNIAYWGDGRLWVFYLLAVTKGTDMGAFFIGRYFGKNHPFPYISPKKTMEGVFGGFAVALCMGILFYFLGLFPFNEALWLSILVSFLAQCGDLAESLLKRDCGFKDSSHLPGLGGMLDVMDSLVFTTPFLYLFLRMTG